MDNGIISSIPYKLSSDSIIFWIGSGSFFSSANSSRAIPVNTAWIVSRLANTAKIFSIAISLVKLGC